MKPIPKLLAATLLVGLPLISRAEGLTYNYLEGGYSGATPRDGAANGPDYGGFYGALSARVAPNAYLFGDYRHLDSDKVGNLRSRLDIAHYGLGVIVPVSRVLHLDVGGGGLYVQSRDSGSGSGSGAPSSPDDHDNGYFVQGIARAWVLPALEVNGGVRHENVFKQGETVGLVGAVFNFTPLLGVSGQYEFGNHYDRYLVGARFNFEGGERWDQRGRW